MEAMTQSGFRSMALMMTESVYHPDIIKFINAKTEEGRIENANISVTVDDAFMRAVIADEKYWTRFKFTNPDGSTTVRKYNEYRARDIFEMIVEGMWKNGEPGILFYNRINDSPYKYAGEELIATNPCSEQPLSENGSCNLGSIDLSKFLDKNNDFDWGMFEIAIRNSMRFLDAVVDKGQFPTPDIAKWAQEHRAVGIGAMGYADLLLMKEIPYGSPEAIKILEDILSFMDAVSIDESEEMGRELGVPEKCKLLPSPRRNITTNTIAPTGCQKAETLIETDSGLFRLSEIIDVNGETWQDINLSVHQDKNTAISNKGFINGLASTKKIKLSSGIDLESTPNHQYKIIRNGVYEWCAAEDIKVGDIFPSKINGYNNSLEADLVQPSYINSKTGVRAKDLRFPSKMTPELAFLLGCFYADGSVHKKGMRISQNPLDKEKIEKIVMIIKDVFDYDAIVEEAHTCTEIYINSVKLLSYLKDNEILKEKSLKVSVPKKIRESSKNSIREFINGYFMCDGCEHGYGYIDTGSYQMAQDSAVLLRATGTNARISERTKIRGRKSDKPMYRVFFVGYGSIDFPKEKERYVKEETRKRYELAKRLLGEHFIADTVINIEDGKCLTYDISVPEENMYVANGVISHNTISLIAGCSSGIEPIFSEITVRNDKTGTYTFENDLAEKPYFRCAVSSNGAQEVTWEEHIETLAATQRHIQSGVSKTINFPNNAKRESIANAVMLAWQKGCKGLAVYRNGSRKIEVLSPRNIKKDLCPMCGKDMVEINGSKRCIFCSKESLTAATSTYYD
jgi:ribonucleoside-diphosphate reductase alpha chain